MSKKKKFILKAATLLMAYAAIIPQNGSWAWIGEPQLPKQMKKEDDVRN